MRISGHAAFAIAVAVAGFGYGGALTLIPYPNALTEDGGSCPTNAPVRIIQDVTVAAEGYRLKIAADGVEIRHADSAGLFYARQTLVQLDADGVGSWPCVTIEDAPRFSWRGLHLDESRHFFGKTVVKRLLDRMSSLKLNILHWHLTDDQGWRIPIRAYPRLNTVGAMRPRPDYSRWVQDAEVGSVYGPFGYTAAEIAEIVAYARERHVRIVPEIEIPGHSREVMMAYPELFCGNAADWLDATGFTNDHKRPDCMHDTVVCLGNDRTIRFFETVLDEVCDLFPDSDVIHIGGDEAPRKNWERCPKCQARMKALSLETPDQLQSWCARHFIDYLARKGRHAIGWSEIMEGGIPKGAFVMSWLTKDCGLRAATNGVPVVMVPNNKCYFDYPQGLDDLKDVLYPRWCIDRTLSVEKVYAYDPCADIPAPFRKYVMGGEACNWTECTWDARALEWKIFPRAFATAEMLWTNAERRDFEAFRSRAERLRERFVREGVNAAPVSAGL